MAKGAKSESAKKSSGTGKSAPETHESEKPAAAKAAHSEAHAGAAHEAGHGHKVDRREIWIVFGVLFALTVLEVLVAQIPGVGRTALIVALVGMAVGKAAIVSLYYMHLKHETRILKLTVAFPLSVPAIYAVILIADGFWRLAR